MDSDSEARLRALFRGFPVPTYAWMWAGEDFVLVDCNEAAERFTSGRIGGFLGSTRRELLERQPDALQAVEALDQCLGERRNLHRELQDFRMADGDLRHLSTEYVFVPPNLVMVHTDDVTARVRAEKAIRESETQYRSLMEQASDAIWVCGADGIYIDVNKSACELLGYTREEYLEMHLRETVMPEELPKTAWVVRSVMAGKTVVTRRQMRHKNGSAVPAELSARRLEDGRIVAIARDLTSRIRLEEELRRSQTLSAMGSLVAGVAHEVRNPLFGISATLDALEAHVIPEDEDTDHSELSQYFQVLRGQIGRLTGLMQDLLEYGRPAVIDTHVGPLGPVVQLAVGSCESLARQRSVAIEVRLAEVLPPLSLDRSRMGQVLINLIENAIQHSAAGSSVVVEAGYNPGQPPDDPAAVEISVSDSGPGISEDDLPHLFVPFFSRRLGGTGLGLSIVQRVVEEHGGRIAAFNRTEGGARLSIRLPVPAAPEEG